jgi:hypothetical protein
MPKHIKKQQSVFLEKKNRDIKLFSMPKRTRERHNETSANQIIANTVIKDFTERLAIVENQLPQSTPENQFFMLMLEKDAPATRKAILKCIDNGLVVFNQVNRVFDFRMDTINCAKFFKETGCTTYKQIARFITINGARIKYILLKDYAKDKRPATKEWPKIKSVLSLN